MSIEVIINSDVKPIKLKCEIADTPEKHMRGLMFRKELPADAGMLFCYDEPGDYGIWMRNTLIPLAILFIDDKCCVQHIGHGKPLCDDSIKCEKGLIKYILEMSPDACKGLGVGAKITLPEGLEEKLEGVRKLKMIANILDNCGLVKKASVVDSINIFEM